MSKKTAYGSKRQAPNRPVLLLMASIVAAGCADIGTVDSEAEAELGTSSQKVIYGSDNRVEAFTLVDASDIANADGTVSLFESSDISNQGDGTSILQTQAYTLARLPDGSAGNLCTDQPFYGQQAGAFCSGFLVAPQIVATAGHCVDSASVTSTRFVFGFRMYDSASLRTRVRNDQIYSGTSIFSTGYPASDWALVNLDRPVTDHKILQVRPSGNVSMNTPVNVIGHPVGLPEKFSGPAPVRSVSASSGVFSTTTDANPGNSGSPVINDANNQVEGILVSGPSLGYTYNSSRRCYEELRCADDGSNCLQVGNTLASMFVNRYPAACVGASNGWQACRGSGCAVCSDAFDASYYDLYFKNHPNCSLNTTCAGQFSSCSGACPAPTNADTSRGSSQSWRACRGSGIYVCQEKLSGYPHYFQNHPRCQPNATCGGIYGNCSLACPPPTEADR